MTAQEIKDKVEIVKNRPNCTKIDHKSTCGLHYHWSWINCGLSA